MITRHWFVIILGLAFLSGTASPTLPADGSPPLSLAGTDVVAGPEESPSRLIRVRATPADPSNVPSVHFEVRNLSDDRVVSEGMLAGGNPVEEAQAWIAVTREELEDALALSVRWSTETDRGEIPITLAPVDQGWTVHFNPGFHYDPVWWNTQAHYTETGKHLARHLGPGIELVSEYLRMCEEDPDYAIVLHQLPYLKTFLEANPHRREELLQRVTEKRCSLVGGTYDELSTTLISAESTIRNAIYGTLFQNDVLGGDAGIFWQCDVFGHDPGFPSIMSQTGHHAGAFARGPFHQWGAPRDQVNFPSEFMWMSPDGRSILTHYMTGHYGYAYGPLAAGSNVARPDSAAWARTIIEMFEDLKRPALTHHVLLPMHVDVVRPLENLGEVVRFWNRNYVNPRAVISTPEAFFDAVRAEADARDLHIPVITRDMNPIYTGCPVSFADLKTVNRECENVLREAEILATLAVLEGAPTFPWRSIDRAWRQLQFNAHHDAITGSMSDQVYVDIMIGYRDALDLARDVRTQAIEFLTTKLPPPSRETANGSILLSRDDLWRVWNPVAHERTDHRIEDKLNGLTLALVASPETPSPRPGARSELFLNNEYLSVTLDPDRGGTLASIVDNRTGREILSGPGNDIVVLEEYETLPGQGEGPWHLSPTGERHEGQTVPAVVLPPDPLHPHRVSLEATYPLFTKRVSYELKPGSRSLDVRTEIKGWRGANQLVRAEFPFDIPGGRPVFETASAIIGRPFARNLDTANDPWTLDQTFWQWVGLGSVLDIEVQEGLNPIHRRSVGVAEIVITDTSLGASADQLAEALVRRGVTSTTTQLSDRRYGDLSLDSNRPDLRILVLRDSELEALYGGADHGPNLRSLHVPVQELQRAMSRILRTEVGSNDPVSTQYFLQTSDLDVLILTPRSVQVVLAQLENLPKITVPHLAAYLTAREIRAEDGVALITRGPVSAHVAPDGVLSLNLLRSCTAWPAGVWIDPPARSLPGGIPLEAMHGTHVFEYSVVALRGGYRIARLSGLAQEINHPIAIDRTESPGDEPVPMKRTSTPFPEDPPSLQERGDIVSETTWLTIDEPAVLLLALKPTGFPDARWKTRPSYRGQRTITIAARFWNGAGRQVTTTLALPALQVEQAWEADLLETPGEPLAVRNGSVELTFEPNQIRTILLEIPRSPSATETGASASLLESPGIHGPRPSAYWLENRGEGVTDNGVVAISPAVRQTSLSSDLSGETVVPVRLVNNHRDRPARFSLAVQSPRQMLAQFETTVVDVAPSSFEEVALRIRRRNPGGTVFREVGALQVEARTEWGTLLAPIWIAPPNDEMTSPSARTYEDGPNPPEIAVETRALDTLIGPGQPARVRVTNRTRAPLTGEASWAIPPILWSSTPDWRQTLHLQPGESKLFQITLDEEFDSWAMLRVAAAGRVAYSEPILLVDDPKRILMSFDVDRARIPGDEAVRIPLTAFSRKALREETPLDIDAPSGWKVHELERVWTSREQESRLEVSYLARPQPQAQPGSLTIHGPYGARTSVPLSRVPVQRALAKTAVTRIDGDLSEWAAPEFTEAESDLGSMRTAVRYGPDGLAFAIEVYDETFLQTHIGANIWRGDSVQLGISVTPSNAVGYDPTDLEFGIAKTPQGDTVWCWYDGTRGQTGDVASASAVVRTEPGRTIYEVLLPPEALTGITLAPGRALGFSYIANDDDGDGFRGAIQWTPGMSGGKDSSLFGDLVLMAN